MEDEQGDGGPVSCNDASELSLSGNLPSETLVQNMGSENQVEDSYEEGEEGEIMVEIVGSDVFVDGISGEREGDVEPGEIEHLEGHVWENREETETQNFPEATSASSEGDENKLGESESKQNYVASVELEVTVSESVDVEGGAVSDLSSWEVAVKTDEVWKPGIEAMDVSSLTMTEPMSGKTEEVSKETSAVVAEEREINDEEVDNNGDIANNTTPDLISHPVEAFVAGEVGIANKSKILLSVDSTISQDNLVADSAISCAKKNEAAGGEVAPPVDPNGEGLGTVRVDGVDVFEETKAAAGGEVVPPGDPYDEGLETAHVDRVDIFEETKAEAGGEIAPLVDPNDEGLVTAHVDGVDVFEETKAAAGGEVAPSVDPHGEGLETARVDRVFEETKAAAGGEVVPPVDPNDEGLETARVDGVDVFEETKAEASDKVAPPVVPNDEGLETARVHEVDVVSGEAGLVHSNAILPVDNQIDSTPFVTMSCNISASEVTTPTGDGGEILTTGSSKIGVSSANAESASPAGDCGINDKVAGDMEILDAESKDLLIPGSDSLHSYVHNENEGLKEFPGIESEATHGTDGASHEQSFAGEREEVMGMDLDDATGFKDGASEVNDLTCASNDEILKSDRDLETDMTLQNHVSSNEQTQLADSGNTSELCVDNGLGIENQASMEQNLAHTANPSSQEDKEIVKADSGMCVHQPLVATAVAEVTNDQNIAISQVKLADADADKPSEKSKGIDAEVATQFIKCHETAKSPALDASAENMHLSEKSASLEVETVDVVVAENLVVCNDPVVRAEVGLNNFVKECGSPQSKTLEVSVVEAETANNGVNEDLESVSLTPYEVIDLAAVSDTNHVNTLQEKTELHVSGSDISLLDGGDIADTLMIDVATLNGEVTNSGEAEDNSSKGNYIVESHTSEAKVLEVEESEYDQSCQEGNEMECREPELGTDEPASDTDKLKVADDEPVKSSSSLRMNQSGYLSPPENDGQFAVSDLVWGKVKSHPWWPGQIFAPDDASDKAVKHYKKDSYLVAYFGDRTFAWNDATLLKPFRMQFSQIEKQSSSETFQHAVSCALEEVSRRVELGLACSCIPKDAYGKIETQVVENTGIREESSRRYGVDQSSAATSFEPDKLLKYVRDLAPRASSGADRLDVVIARAQLSAFCRFKGYRPPTDFLLSGELLENDADTEQIGDEMVGSHKNKHIPKDSLESPKKERTLTDLMGDATYSPDGEDESVAKDPSKSVFLSSGNKRKALDSLADGSDKRASVYAAKISTTTNQTPKPSFKIGECIRRVASQLTGHPAMGADGSPKINEHSERQSMVVSAESSSVNEMLLQLQLVAQDPKKGHNFLNTIKTFFSGFRSSIAVNKRGRKKKSDKAINGSAEEFEFDDVNDSYWTDRIVQNHSEKQLMHNSENGTGNLQLVPFDAERSVKPGRKPHSRKRYFSGNYPTASSELDEKVKRKKQEASPAELILNFAERTHVPSEINLNKMFRRFGPLMESETEVDHDSGRVRVIFKRGSDAEVAHSSAQKFSIFGPVLVNYEIGYSPLISVKILPLALPQHEEDATVML